MEKLLKAFFNKIKFKLMRGYTGEMEYSVWNDMMSRISKFQKLAESLGCKDAMNKIVTEVVVPTGKKNEQNFEIVRYI